MKSSLLVALALITACGGAAEHRALEADHDLSRPRAAIGEYVAAGRTPVAFSQLALALEPARGGDPIVAADAELRLLALAAPHLAAARSQPFDTQIDVLALTVWPALLSDPLTEPVQTRVTPLSGESAAAYLARLCAGPLAQQCAGIPDEVRPYVVRALAMRSANERMSAALARCLHCSADGPEWARAGWTFESLDVEATHHSNRFRRLAGTFARASRAHDRR